MNRALLTSKNQNWGTPGDVFCDLNRMMRFTLDACAVAKTAKCRRYVGPNEDGLNFSWRNFIVFNNPPYNDMESWMPKARNESLAGPAMSANLVPYRPDPDWWADGVLSEDGRAGRLLRSYYDHQHRVLWLRFQRLVTGIHSVKGRIPFIGKTASGKPTSAPFPSAVIFHSTPGLQPARREGLTALWPR